jgi:ribosomal protein S12 methylthiotransferase accessory factor
MAIGMARLGDIGSLWPKIAKLGSARYSLSGNGVGLSEEAATYLAVAEGLERYSSCVYRTEQFTLASADALGEGHILDLRTVPRCSQRELLQPHCPIVAPDTKAPIRWVRGVSLLDGTVKYVPAIMVYLHLGFATPAERFWFPISTGCAAHTSYDRAVLAGIYEVIERDALCITWLQQLELPMLRIDTIPPLLAPYWDRYMNASADVEYRFFDATLDLNVPVVYGVQIARCNTKVRTLVSCSTGITMAQAVAKCIRDMTAIRGAFRQDRPVPVLVDDFFDMLHGATYMAHADRSQAFDFLLKGTRYRKLSSYPDIETDPTATLEAVINTLRRQHLSTFVVDLSTDEAIRCGMRVVRVLIPGLQPLSFHYRARFLGHPRLYDCPRQNGYRCLSEEQLNCWPQPFA